MRHPDSPSSRSLPRHAAAVAASFAVFTSTAQASYASAVPDSPPAVEAPLPGDGFEEVGEDIGEELMEEVVFALEEAGEQLVMGEEEVEGGQALAASTSATSSKGFDLQSMAGTLRTPGGVILAAVGVAGVGGITISKANKSKRRGRAKATKSKIYGTSAADQRQKVMAADLDLDLMGDAVISAPAQQPPELAKASAPETITPMTAPVPEPAPAVADKSKGTQRKRPMFNMFNKNKGPQRPTSLEEAFGATEDGEEEASSARAMAAELGPAIAAALAEHAPAGMFDLGEVGLEGHNELKGEMAKQGREVEEVAKVVADVVNAMVVGLVERASEVLVKTKSKAEDGEAVDALDDLIKFMDGAGAVFGELCPGVAVDPPIRYNGSLRKGKLEDLFRAYSKNAMKAMGQNPEAMGQVDRLQDVLDIKASKANSISQKVMMDALMGMMKDGGEGMEGMEGLASMLGDMGGASAGGLPGMPQDMDPETMKQQMAEFKSMVQSGNISKEEVEELRKMYKDMGMDIDSMVRDVSAGGESMDAESTEMLGLLQGLLQEN
ncbi:unnamed protein product [Chrysoparadoxa australica]